ncbi:MAG TPA: hypothetical protein VJ813_19020 [Vicinamibacterales bacterium]|nr:hypothetical protein [Vicinamibacterales bacterium]
MRATHLVSTKRDVKLKRFPAWKKIRQAAIQRARHARHRLKRWIRIAALDLPDTLLSQVRQASKFGLRDACVQSALAYTATETQYRRTRTRP